MENNNKDARFDLTRYWADNGIRAEDLYCRECGVLMLDPKDNLTMLKYNPNADKPVMKLTVKKNGKTVQYKESPGNRWLVRGRTLSGKTYFRHLCWDCFFKHLPEVEDIQQRARKSSWYRDVNNGIFRPPATCSSPSKYFKLLFDITDEELEKEHQKFDTASLESFIRRHGEEEGKRKYEEYKKRQAYTCSKEYMMGEKGMTEEEWNQFNANRACTKWNFIKRYGEELGKKKWKEYCELESYAGCSIEYFIDKYGEKEGAKKYSEVNAKKMLTEENFIRKYGEEEGKKRFDEYNRHSARSYSSISQRMFEEIDNRFEVAKARSRYAMKGGEVGVTYREGDIIRNAILDYCLDNRVIEFNGDYYHANPSLYDADDYIDVPEMVARDIWTRDGNRNEGLAKEGYDIHIVWENDYRKDPEKTINECVEFLQGRKKPDFSAHDDENMWKEGVQS